MKKYITIVSLCILASLYCAEKPIRIAQEWNAELYDKGNKVQHKAFSHYLKQNNINPSEKRILDIGCGTGNITQKLARTATHIDGFDPSKNMINFAQKKYQGITNLTFQYAFAEDFAAKKPYDLAIASFSFHWFEDKQKALQQIYASLEKDGEFFFTAHTSEDPKSLNLIVAEEMMALQMGSLLKSAADLFSTNQSKAIGSSYPTRDELRAMLHDAGFKIIMCEQQSCCVTLKNREELEHFQRPIVMSRPIVKYIPTMLQEYLFTQFIDRMIPHMKQTDNQEFIEEITTTIVHVRKK